MYILDSMGMSLSKLWEMVKDREACPWAVLQPLESQRVKHNSVTEQISIYHIYIYSFMDT